MKLAILAIIYLITMTSFLEASETLEDQIKKNTLIEIFDDETPIISDVVLTSIESGMAGSTLSQTGQFLLKIEAYGEHYNTPSQSIRYLHLDFVYLQGQNKNKLAIKISPFDIGLKNTLSTGSEFFLGLLPLNFIHDDFLLQNSMAKVSLIAIELNHTIPINLATLIVKSHLDLFSHEMLQFNDFNNQKERVELAKGTVDLNLQINNLISFFITISQSIYLNDFNKIYTQWTGETQIGLGTELGLKLGDLNALVYFSGGFRRRENRNEGYLEIGIKLSDIFAPPTNEKKKK